MNKSKYFVGIVFSVIFILVSIYLTINIFFVLQIENGITYDGFGNEYSFDEPNSPYTLIAFLCGFTGLFLFIYCYKKINNNSTTNYDYDIDKNEDESETKTLDELLDDIFKDK